MSAGALFVYALLALAAGCLAWYLETHHGAQLASIGDVIFRPRRYPRQQAMPGVLSTRGVSAGADSGANQVDDGSDLAK